MTTAFYLETDCGRVLQFGDTPEHDAEFDRRIEQGREQGINVGLRARERRESVNAFLRALHRINKEVR